MRHWCWIVWFALSGPGFGQAPTTAEIRGTVTDSSGGRVAYAAVTATDRSTGAPTRVMASAAGEFRFVLLPPGTYDLEAGHVDFQSQSAQGIAVTVGASEVVDFRLPIKADAQSTTVTGTASRLESQGSQLSGTLGQFALENLPVDRRAVLAFTYLLPGIADSRTVADFHSFRVPQSRDSGVAISGGNGRGNHFTLDGGEINNAAGGVRPMVGQEAVREFQVSRANYSAENGTARGGVVNIVTRSGTNQHTGSLFGLFGNGRLDATPPFSLVLDAEDRLQRVRPASSRQQFGGSFSGPVLRGRSFYFASYEQLRRRDFTSIPLLTDASIFLPTPEQQRVLATLPRATALLIGGLLTASEGTRELFRTNSGISPFQADQYQGFFRADHRIDDRNQFNLRFYATKVYETSRNLAGLTARSRGDVEDDLANSFGAAWTHVFSARIANEFRAQFNYAALRSSSIDPYGPGLEIAGYGSFHRDPFLPTASLGRREEIVDNVYLTRVRHSLKLGGYALIRNTHSDSATLFAGRFLFGSLPGDVLGPAFSGTIITALQAFNLGLPQAYQQGFGNPIVAATYPLYAAYAQDSWRARPTLSLHYGLRWEADNRRSPLPSNRRNFSPRSGFAWSPSSKLVVRGGFGIFYSVIEYQIDYAVSALNEIQGTRQITQILRTLDPANPLAPDGPVNIYSTLRAQQVIGIPAPVRSILASDLAQFGIQTNTAGPRPPFTVMVRNTSGFRNPYAQQASLEVQTEVAGEWLLTAGLVHIRGVHLTTSLDANLLPAPPDPSTGLRNWGPAPGNPDGTKYFRDPLLFQDNVYESGANSWYSGFTAEATRRLTRRFAFTANYSFTKALDETSDYEPDYQPSDQTCRRCEHALSPFDQRHKIVMYGQVEAPAGLRLTPVFRYNSSHPFNLLAGTEVNNDRHNTTDRPLYAGRNIGIGPAYRTLDLRTGRTFHFGEGRSLQLSMDAFNLFNHLNYATVNNIVGTRIPDDVHGRHHRNPSQPLGFTSAFHARRLQLGFRLAF